MKHYIAIDIGGTKLKHGIIDEEGKFVEKSETASNAHRGAAHLVELVTGICKDYVDKYTIDAVGISTAGMVDVEKGEIIYSGKQIPDYKGVNWKKIIREQVGLACEVENDVNCAGLSEAIRGAAKGANICVCITVGTGIGSCMVINGEVFHGSTGSAFEVGYMHTGKDAIYQDLASTTALIEKVAARHNKSKSEIDGRWIFERAKMGDSICNEEIDNLMENLAIGIANICYVVNPEVVVLGGGIMEQSEFLAPRLGNSLKKVMLDVIREKTKFTFAENGNNAGMLGAFFHMRRRMGEM